eukprot:4143376-Pleurochrysis_carterae.AAC.1
MSVAHLLHCCTAAAPPSPRMSLISVAPPMRHPFPPNSPDGSSPAAAAMAFTTLRESVEDHHGDTPSAPTNSGVRLGIPNVRSACGTRGARFSHMMHNAS